MPAIFSAIHPSEEIASMFEIQTLIDSFHESRQTGLVRLAYSPTENLYLFFKRGDVLASSFITPDHTQAFTHAQWREKIQSAGDAYLKPIPLSSFGLLLSGLSMQLQGAQAEELSTPEKLSGFFNSKTRVMEPSLVQLNWRYSAGLVFFPERKDTPHSIYVSSETVLDVDGVSYAFDEWEDSKCEASVYFPDSSVELWQEYRLRRLFADICSPVLARFEVLTGHALMESLVRLMMIFASNHDLDISISSRSLVNREVFFSAEIAASTYRTFLSEIFEHCSAVIGPRLLASTLREIVTELPAADKDMIKSYRLLPKGIFYD
ncbi:MAG: hypothetical protein Q8L87_08840 [Anaerolineales bacterium]|nr:hypothetical protein [Anaerolineales bacterium]